MNPLPHSSHSYLFVPGNRPERFAKACAAGADVVIVDLEDAVPASEKGMARNHVAAWLTPAQPVLIRINSAETVWFEDDLALCRLPGVAGIVLPKAEGVDALMRVQQAGAHQLLPLIESAQGFAQLSAIAQCPAVQRLLFGTIDFKLDMGIEGDAEELLYFRSQLVLTSRIAGIQAPVDGVTTALHDTALLSSETLRARRLGFGGKLCIHPAQVATVNQCFAPSQQDVTWALRILATVAAVAVDGGADGAAVAVDGNMVDRPVILKAQQIVKAAGSQSPVL